MAVSDSSNPNSNSPVQEEVDSGTNITIHSRFADKGDSTRRKHVGTIKRSKPRKRGDTEDKDSESLSDIDDYQISGYFNNKAEMQYKKILWEGLNRQHTNATKQKRTMEAKKPKSAKKAKTGEKVEVQKRSSKINYDVLEALREELGEDGEDIEDALNIGADSSSYPTEDEAPDWL